jgi:hypothetical protein
MKKISFLFVALALVFCSQVYADTVLLNNLDQSPAGLWNAGSTIGQAFKSGQAVTIDSATFRIDYGGYIPSENAYLTIQDADAQGKISSTILDKWTTVSSSGVYAIYSGTYALAANTEYWLIIHDTDASVARVSSTTSYTANFGASLPTTYNNYESSTGMYYSLAEGPLMFKVTAVPEPATMILLGSGILGLALLRRRFKR